MLYATRVMQVIAVAGGRGRRRPDVAETENPQKPTKERENAYHETLIGLAERKP
jgi:hypothetical protein